MLWSTLLNEIDDSLAPRESVMVLHIQGGFFLKRKLHWLRPRYSSLLWLVVYRKLLVENI